MATTTTNFGWDIPQSTDLVKDGATAIAALGQDIDTALVDLKGGTTGQVLAKASNTDLDFTWSSIDPLTILDAKGDLISATAADTPARLAVGSNGQVLTADSAEATGLKWATPGGALDIAQIATGTLSGSGISLTGLSNYDVLELRVNGANISSNDQNLRVYANNDTTSSNWEYAIGFVSSRSTYNAADYDGAQAASAGHIPITNNLGLMASNTANRFFIRLTNCKSAGMTFVDYWSVYRFSAGGTQTNCWAVGTAIWKTEAAISSLQFNSQFNTFSAGTYTLWGA